MSEQSVVADLDGIKKQIEKLSSAAKTAAENSRKIGQELQFDPNNLKNVVARFQSLKTELEKNNELAIKYDDALKKLAARRDELKDIANQTEAQKKEYADVRRQIDIYETALKKAKNAVQYLTAATDKHAVSLKVQKTIIAQVKERFEGLQKAANVAAGIMTALVTATTRLAKSSIQLGSELYNLSVRYDTSAESIQIWNRALQLATGETDLFTSAVNTMIKGISQITSGRGVAYQKALRNIGLSFKDIEELTTSERFETIVRALGDVADASDRVSYAQQLLGESGQSIAGMFEREGFALDTFLEKATEYGTLTQQNAQSLAEMSYELEYAKSQFQLAGAQLTTALVPTLELIVPIIQAFANGIKAVANAFKAFGKVGQGFLLVLSTLIILSPLVIKLITAISQNIAIMTTKAINGTAAVTGLTRAMAGLKIAMGALGIVSAILIPVIGAIAGAINNAKEAADDFGSIANDYAGIANDIGGTIEQSSVASTERNINVSAEIYGHGDTTISDEAAVKVAQITADEINKSLGDLIKGNS